MLKLLHLDLLVPNNLQLKIADLTETVHVYEHIIISILKNNGNCYRIFITCSDHSLVHVKFYFIFPGGEPTEAAAGE